MKEYKMRINGTDYVVNINDISDNVADLTVNGVAYHVDVEGIATKPTKPMSKPAQARTLQSEEPVAKPKVKSGSAAALRSPLPGTILDVMVAEGDKVKAGQTLILLEAMKMENNIEADRDGVVEQIAVRKEDSVLEGDVLLTIK